MINQQAAAGGVPGPGYLNPAIYTIGQGAGYAAAFHDITTGNNTNLSSPTNYFAVSGYDLCTGWGTPTGSNLIAALHAPGDALAISPGTGLVFERPTGGPFGPGNQSCVLTNTGGSSLAWTVVNSALWLNVTPLSGTLSAGGAATVLNLTMTPVVSRLAPGIYSATLWFTNSGNGVGQSRTVVLTVDAAPVVIPGVALTTLYSFTGGNDGGFPNGLTAGNDGALYGTTRTGGGNSWGSLFRMAAGGSPGTLYSFSNGSDGGTPFATLAQGVDGGFYGATVMGGAYGNGTLFRMSPGGAVTTLLAFNLTNGNLPYAGLTLAGDSSFYGVCDQGGPGSFGIAYNVTTNGALSVRHAFANGSDGGQPLAGLLAAGDGNFYGTSYAGGAFNEGTVFQLTTHGTVSTLVSFNGTNGARPRGGLAQDAAGNFFGVASLGGAGSNGTIFELTAAGVMTNVCSFTGGHDGAQPVGGLCCAGDGNFYGSTAYGGTYGKGTVFRLTPGGGLTTLISFNGRNGANPQAPMVVGPAGAVYGTTPAGGVNNRGTLFTLAISSPLQIVTPPASQAIYIGQSAEFNAVVTGSAPFSWQWRKNSTNLNDGVTVSGSSARVLRLTNTSLGDAGSYSVIVSNTSGVVTSAMAALTLISSAPFFVIQPANQTLAPGTNTSLTALAQGNQPLYYQWQKNGANLTDGGNTYGSSSPVLTITNLTESNNGTYGVIASNSVNTASSSNAILTVIPPSTTGTVLATLYSFTGHADGGPPNALTVGTNGIIYGTTEFGLPAATVFTVSTNGAVATLAAFGSATGPGPVAAMTQGADGNFYGSTEFGGTNYVGDIFEMTPAGLLTNIYSFTGGLDGGSPTNALTLGADGCLYGTTPVGGSAGAGNVFKLASGGILTNLYSFTNGVDGADPVGALTVGADGNFYGMTANGSLGYGNIFRMTPQGALTNLYTFTGGRDGSVPVGSLASGTDGYLYGATKHNMISVYPFYGTLFKISTNGAFTSLYSLNYTDGAYPFAGLILDSDGNFYGTTYSGENANNGTVFRITPAGSITTLLAFDGFDDGAHPMTPVVEGPDGALYGTTSSGGWGGRGTVYRLGFTSAPQFSTPPASQTVVAGTTARFSATYFGARPLTCQWQFNSTNLLDGGNISGSAGRVLTIGNVTMANAGTYSLVISNSLNFAASAGAALGVIPGPAFQSVRVSQGVVTFVVSTVPTHVYQMQSAPDLTSGVWTNFNAPVRATGNSVTMTDAVVTNSQRYYRIEFVR